MTTCTQLTMIAGEFVTKASVTVNTLLEEFKVVVPFMEAGYKAIDLPNGTAYINADAISFATEILKCVS